MAEPILISACLLGLETRYDGASKPCDALQTFLQSQDVHVIPICPEQLGGLPTPRPPAQISSGSGEDVLTGEASILDEHGNDYTEPFVRGAKMTLRIAEMLHCRRAILKEYSPSCGVHYIRQGEETKEGQGLTATLLQQSGFQLQSEEDVSDG